MNITKVFKNGDVVTLLFDNGLSAMCRDGDTEGWYEKYLSWVAEGNTAEEWTGN
jgi:hypothetical protein